VLCSSLDPLKPLKDHLEVELQTVSDANDVILNSMCSSEAEMWENFPKSSETITINPTVLGGWTFNY